MRYFALIDGVAQGPFTVLELAKFPGQDYYVCPEGGTAWVRAGDVLGGSTEGASAAPRYYAYVGSQMYGPFAPDGLKAYLKPDLQVCAEGGQEWQAARDVPAFATLMASAAPVVSAPAGVAAFPPGAFGPRPVAAAPPGATSPPGAGGRMVATPTAKHDAPESAPKDLPPLLKELWLICRNASDELLFEQKSKHWKSYYKTEQKIIAAELTHRGVKV